MAKKAEAEAGTFSGRDGAKFYKEGGKGKKGPCPKCGVFVGARHTGVCPNPDCDHEFVAKDAKKKDTRQKELDFSFGETLELLKKVKTYAKEAGGTKKLREQIESLEEITMQVGGLPQLKEALEALEEF
jgi:uncharacterized Zn finger protein (UPF0148 family)